jgi:hypothetical protein
MMPEQQPIIKSAGSYPPLSRNLSHKDGDNWKKLVWLQLVFTCVEFPQHRSSNQGEQLAMQTYK